MKYSCLLAAALLLSGCLGSDNSSVSSNSPGTALTLSQAPGPAMLLARAANPDFPASGSQFTSPACSLNAAQPRVGGGIYNVNLQSASGHNISFTVFEPASFNCRLGNPLVLEGHGYGGAKASSPRGIMPDLIAAGVGVISIDQRGFGQSGGTVRVMDPDFEGQDLLQIMDWAEANLDWMRYSNSKPVAGRQFNPVMGATGSSYGGGFQLLIHNIDPKKRLDALTPDITWNDLRYSLNPGGAYGIADFMPAQGAIKPAGSVKSGWALLLVAAGEAGSLSPKLQAGDPMALQSSGQDNLIRETLLRGATANRFPDGALEFFRYHSPSYWCDPEVAGAQTFLQSELKPGLIQKTPDPVDILFTQGFRDTLFNFNEAWHNFTCYRGLKNANGQGADVRLVTHQNGHILPLTPAMVPGLADLAEQGAQNGLNEIEFQKPAGPFACGALSIPEAQFSFLVEKLLTASELAAVKALKPRKAFDLLAANKGKVCLSLNDDVGLSEANPDAAVWVTEEAMFARQAPRAKGQLTQAAVQPVAVNFTPGADPLAVVTSAVTGILRYPFAPAVMPIELPAGVRVVAGIPTAVLEVTPPVDMLMNPLCTQLLSVTAMSPVGLAGLEPGCDPVLYLGLGVNRNGGWRLIDDQLTAVRGFGKRHVELTGVAERLAPGESLGLLVYGFHPQYLATGSRDLATPLVGLKGSLNIPTL